LSYGLLERGSPLQRPDQPLSWRCNKGERAVDDRDTKEITIGFVTLFGAAVVYILYRRLTF
jgi:hypothetical protein